MNRQSARNANPLQQYRSYNYDLLAIAAFTLINVLLVLFKSETYFLFSAYLPYWLVLFCAVTTGYLPVEDVTATMNSGAFVAAIVFALVAVAVYAVLWFFSRKTYIPLIVGAVLMGIDTVSMFVLTGFEVSMILDYIFHGVVLYCLIRGIMIGKQLKAQGVDLESAYAAPDPSDMAEVSAPSSSDSFYTPSATSAPTAPADNTDASADVREDNGAAVTDHAGENTSAAADARTAPTDIPGTDGHGR